MMRSPLQARCRPSGLNASARISAPGTFELVKGFLGIEIPKVNRVRRIGTREQAAVGAERHRVDLGGVAVEDDHRLQRVRIPDARRGVPAGGDEKVAAGMPGQGRDAIGVSGQTAVVGAVRQVPDADRLIFAGYRQPFAVGADREGADRFFVKRQTPCRIPDDGPVRPSSRPSRRHVRSRQSWHQGRT